MNLIFIRHKSLKSIIDDNRCINVVEIGISTQHTRVYHGMRLWHAIGRFRDDTFTCATLQYDSTGVSKPWQVEKDASEVSAVWRAGQGASSADFSIIL